MSITKIIAALLVLGSVSFAQANSAHAASEAWMDRASQNYSGGGY